MTNISFAEKIEPFTDIYSPGQPILSENMFFGREKELSMIQQNFISDENKIILITGWPGIGKTSLLHQICNRQAYTGIQNAVVNMAALLNDITCDDDFFEQVGNAILRNESYSGFQMGSGTEARSSGKKLIQIIKHCIEKSRPRKFVLIFDDYDRIDELLENGDLTPDGLNWIETVLTKPLHLILAGTPRIRRCVSDQVAEKAMKIEMSPFTEKDAWDLMTKPLRGKVNYQDRSAIQKVHRLSGGHPFYIHYLCKSLLDYVYACQRNVIMMEDLDQVVENFVQHPPEQVLKTWERLSWDAMLSLSALADSIENPDHFSNATLVNEAVSRMRLPIKNTGYLSAIDWINDNSYIIDRKFRGTERFRIDLFRHWVVRNFKSLKDLDRRRLPRETAVKTKQKNRKYPVIIGGLGFAAACIVFLVFQFAISNSEPDSTPGKQLQASTETRINGTEQIATMGASESENKQASISDQKEGMAGADSKEIAKTMAAKSEDQGEIASMPDAAKVEPPEYFNVGDRVKIKTGLTEPCEGWGSFKSDMILTVVQTELYGKYLKVKAADGDTGVVCPADVESIQ